jgi:hypothetical protein
MRFRIICVSWSWGLMFRHAIRGFVLKMNMRWYEHQAIAARGALRQIGEVMPVRVVAAVRIPLLGEVS